MRENQDSSDVSGNMLAMVPIARIRTPFPQKFGVPRQSGLVEEIRARVVFEPEYRNPDALRGIEGFSHLWLLWHFHQAAGEGWSPTVRPPRLGGNTRMGVFATRSPFRPNPIGLSCVKLLGTKKNEKEGTVLLVSGADLVDGTPILDIKPYLPYTDAHPEAQGGFAPTPGDRLEVVCPPEWKEKLSPETAAALMGVLACDPRPSYQNDPDRVYGMEFDGYTVQFTVADERLFVKNIFPEKKENRRSKYGTHLLR